VSGAGGRPEPAGAGLAAEYRAAREAAILADRSRLGRLAFTGKDAADLLHRLSTNGIKDLRPGQGTATVFTTSKGRILDLVEIYRLEDRLLALTGPGRARSLLEWIDRYTFREEVRGEDWSATHGTLGIFGARAARVVAALCGEEAAARPRHHPGRVDIGGAPAILARTYPLAGEGFHLTAEAKSMPAIGERIRAAGGVTPAGEECLELLRIEAGLPAHGRELTEEHNPWEARLHDAVSLSKGCYVGQEVIARLDTYDKVSRCLVRLRVEGGEAPPPGSILEAGGERTGILTSAAAVPGEGWIAALGYVREADAAAGTALTVRAAGAGPGEAGSGPGEAGSAPGAAGAPGRATILGPAR
jgi:folate-binding protein YgfZ